MPTFAQSGLLYLPLFFHEFGHLLYACHEPELDNLVSELQDRIRQLLMPSVRRGDPLMKAHEEKRNVIVETWYEWAQELFCDAVGLSIAGPAFAHAFSIYLRMRGRGAYHLPEDKLGRSEHPVTRLRIRMITARARSSGYDSDALILETDWNAIAGTLGLNEDYFGYYEAEFEGAVQETIDDMLTEAQPRLITERELPGDHSMTFASPIHVLNEAWYQFLTNTDTFPLWEKAAIPELLKFL
jgi:hypothetical protein